MSDVNWPMVNTLVTIGGFVCLVSTVMVKVGGIVEQLRGLKSTISAHANQLERHENVLFNMVQNLSRLIGRSEIDNAALRSNVDMGGRRVEDIQRDPQR